MKKLRDWIGNRVLTTWVREELTGEINKLRRENDRLRAKVDGLNAYINGLEDCSDMMHMSISTVKRLNSRVKSKISRANRGGSYA